MPTSAKTRSASPEPSPHPQLTARPSHRKTLKSLHRSLPRDKAQPSITFSFLKASSRFSARAFAAIVQLTSASIMILLRALPLILMMQGFSDSHLLLSSLRHLLPRMMILLPKGWALTPQSHAGLQLSALKQKILPSDKTLLLQCLMLWPPRSKTEKPLSLLSLATTLNSSKLSFQGPRFAQVMIKMSTLALALKARFSGNLRIRTLFKNQLSSPTCYSSSTKTCPSLMATIAVTGAWLLNQVSLTSQRPLLSLRTFFLDHLRLRLRLW